MWQLDDERALVVTADFITPLVDDARTWGRIAAANSASDVYAMGGRPLLALNLVGWHTDELPTSLLEEVLAGAEEMAKEGGWVTVGGHTVDDPEPKFGLVVIGEVHPGRILTNTGLRPGDVVLLTKPLGTGVISTAVKAGRAPDDAADAAVDTMTRLNAEAAAVALDAGVTGATDVTGFGLLGHLGRMAQESGVDVELDVGAVPLLPHVRELAAEGLVPGGSRRNLDWIRERVDAGDHGEDTLLLLADAQTSGGLVFGVEEGRAERALGRLRDSGHDCAAIGQARQGAGRIVLS